MEVTKVSRSDKCIVLFLAGKALYDSLCVIMPSTYNSYLRVLPENQELCLLCEKSLPKNKKDAQKITGESGWKTLISKAEQWSKINIPLSDKYYCFKNVFSKVYNVSEPFGRRHNTCRIDFSGKLGRHLSSFGVVSYNEEHGMLQGDDSDNTPGITDSSINISATRLTRSSSDHIKVLQNCALCVRKFEHAKKIDTIKVVSVDADKVVSQVE